MISSEVKKEYRQGIPIESLVTSQINRIMEYRTKRLTEYFIESVEALIDLLPPEMEETVVEYKKNNMITFDVSPQGKTNYINLFRFIKKQLTQENIVWKRSRGFEVGHD